MVCCHLGGFDTPVLKYLLIFDPLIQHFSLSTTSGQSPNCRCMFKTASVTLVILEQKSSFSVADFRHDRTEKSQPVTGDLNRLLSQSQHNLESHLLKQHCRGSDGLNLYDSCFIENNYLQVNALDLFSYHLMH